MSEYHFVEKPLLTQLASMRWQVHEQGTGIPKDPTQSLRTNFREVLLKDEFIKSVNTINHLDNGQPWLTDNQLESLYDDFTNFNATS